MVSNERKIRGLWDVWRGVLAVWGEWWGDRLVDTLLYNERRLGCVSWLIRESGGYKRLLVSL